MLGNGGAKISKKPTDPKYAAVEYTYSVTENNKEYQLAGAMESDGVTGYTDSFSLGVFAANTVDNLTAYIQGNYNGLMARTKLQSNATCILALPTIILSDTSSSSGTVLNSGDARQQTNLVFNKKGNLPGSYTNNNVVTATGSSFAYTPLAQASTTTVGSGVTAYCNTTLPADATSVTTLMTTLQNIYQSSGISSDAATSPQVANLVSATGAALVSL